MSFEDIWETNKKLIIGILCALPVFSLSYCTIESTHEDKIATNESQIARSQRRAKANKLPRNALRTLESRVLDMRDDLEALEKEFAFQPAPGFTLVGLNRASDVHFNDMIQKLLVEVVEPAAMLDIRIPAELGMGTVTPKSAAEREWYLNGLDIVNRICLSGIGAGVESIEPIKIAKMPKRDRRDRGDADGYLRPLTVTFTARGRPDAIDAMVTGLQQPGQRLVVEKAKIQSMDGMKKGKRRVVIDESLVVLEMTVKALLLDPEGKAEGIGPNRM